jgi:Tol biopolymer transport system component
VTSRGPVVAVLAIASALAGCGSDGRASPTIEAARSPSIPSGSVPSTPSRSRPAASVRIGLGSVAFDRYEAAFGADGLFLGSAILNSEGVEHALEVPVPTVLLMPAWSRDGNHLVVNIYADPGPGRPGVMRGDGTEFRLLRVSVDGDLGCTDWSPDGKLLACFVNGSSPKPDGIYTLNVADLLLKRVTQSPFHIVRGATGDCGGGDSRPRFSPDGSQIAFIRQRCGSGSNPSADESAAIEIVNVDGTGPRELVPQGRVRSHPGSQLSWSPDGKSIVYGTPDGRLFIVDADSGDRREIALPSSLGAAKAVGPDWSLDGERLVFSMFIPAEGSTDLFTIRPDGSDLARLTTSAGAESWARWYPVAGS